MQLNAQLTFANPCDDEEDNLATVGCHSDQGQLFIISRYPDEDSVDLMLDDDDATVRDLKVSLSDSRLLVELAAGDTDLFEGDVLEIDLKNALTDLDELEQALRVILDGTGTFVRED